MSLQQTNIINKITGSFYFTVLQVVMKSEALYGKSSLQDVKQ